MNKRCINVGNHG